MLGVSKELDNVRQREAALRETSGASCAVRCCAVLCCAVLCWSHVFRLVCLF